MHDGKITLENEKKDLMRLLNISSDVDIKKDHPLTLIIQNVYQNQHDGNFKNRDLWLYRIKFLILELKIIEQYDTKLLEEFAKKIKTAGYDEFFGERLEISVASLLIDYKTKFKKRESPDFEINFNSDKIFLECTSAHVTITPYSERVIINKIKLSLRKKAKKPYSNQKTALFIEISNLAHTGHTSIILHQDELKKYLEKKLFGTNYGSLIIYAYYYNADRGGYQSGYARIDNKTINENLLKFLNQCYPFGKESVKKIGILNQG